MQNNYVYYVIDFKYNTHPVVYIGKGSANKKYDRIKGHLFSYKYINSAFAKWLKKRISEYSKKEIKKWFIIYKNNLTVREAYKLEKQLIKKYKKIYNLLNLNDGGEGGISPSKYVKHKISIANKGKFVGKKNGNYLNAKNNIRAKNPFYGKKHLKITKNIMNKRFFIYDATKKQILIINNLSNFLKKHKLSTAIYRYKNSLYCNRWCILGNVYKQSNKKRQNSIFKEKIKKLDQKYLKNKEKNSQIALKKKTTTQIKQLKLKKLIKQLGRNKKVISIWTSSENASKYYNISSVNILKCCNNKKYSYSGFQWKFVIYFRPKFLNIINKPINNYNKYKLKNIIFKD